MASFDTLASLGREVGRALGPLANALGSPARARDFLEGLGWQFTTPPPEVMALGPVVNGVIAIVEQDEIGDAQIPQLLGSVAQAVGAIADLATAPGLPADFKAEFPRQVLDFLIVERLFAGRPAWAYFLMAIGIIRYVPSAPGGTREPFTRRVLALEDLKDFLADPLGYLKTSYAWGTSTFDGPRLADSLSGLLDAWGFSLLETPVDPPSVVAQLNAGALPTADDDSTAVKLVLVEDAANPAVSAGAGLFLLPETAADKPGFALLPFSSAVFETGIGVSNDVTLTIGGAIDLAVPVGVFVRPSKDIQFLSGLNTGAPTPLSGELDLTLALDAPREPFLLLGAPDSSRVEFAGVSTKAGVRLGSNQKLDVVVELRLVGGKLVLDPSSDGDGFINSLVPGGGAVIPLDLGVGFSTTRGMYLLSAGTFEVTVPAHVAVGPLEVQTATIAVRPTADVLPIKVTAALTANLSVVRATVDGVGFAVNLTLPANGKGNLGFADVRLAFVPPTGLGISVEAGPVSGGGFIAFDPANGRYSGALELSVYGVAVKAFGIIETKVPGGGFSFLIIISAEFTPVQLGLGFTLNGVGGLAGINRTVDAKGLLDTVRSGRLENVLFPRDVVNDAPAIIHDVGALFPPAAGHYVFGPLAKIGWGTPTLVEAELGLVLELPGPRLVILGTIHAALPSKKEALVELNLDVGGLIDFPKKYFALDASLHDSRIGDFPVSGDMALRLTWGQNPNFALAVGGFNPHYNPPPSFPKLRPMTVDLGQRGNPSVNLQGYLALTSNTAQVGALLEARVSGGGAELYGFLGFDALFVFSPFSFMSDIEGGVKVSFHGHGFSLHFHGHISGPSPWHLDGKVCVSILFWDACVGFSLNLGGEARPALPGLDPWDGTDGHHVAQVIGLREALTDVRNWAGGAPPASSNVVTLVAAAPGVPAPVDPLGSATVRQKAVPLDLPITRFAGTKPSVARTFDISQITIGQTITPGQPPPTNVVVSNPDRVFDFFAPAEFQAMKDADKLSSPSFVQMAAGVTFSSDAITVGAALPKGLTYHTVLFHADGTETESDDYNPTATQVTSSTSISATALAGIRAAALARFLDPTAPPKVRLGGEGYVLSSPSTLKVAPGFSLTKPVPRPVAFSALLAATLIDPTAGQTLQVTPVFNARP